MEQKLNAPIIPVVFFHMDITTYFSGAITVLIAGLYWAKASSVGAILALFGGLSALIGLEPIREALSINFLSAEEIGLLSILITIIMMIFGSILFPDKDFLK